MKIEFELFVGVYICILPWHLSFMNSQDFNITFVTTKTQANTRAGARKVREYYMLMHESLRSRVQCKARACVALSFAFPYTWESECEDTCSQAHVCMLRQCKCAPCIGLSSIHTVQRTKGGLGDGPSWAPLSKGPPDLKN